MNYIYFKKEDWDQNRSAIESIIGIDSSNIYQAYAQAAQRMKFRFDNLPDNFVDNVINLLDFSPDADKQVLNKLGDQFGSSFFSDIQSYVAKGLTGTSFGGNLTLGNANVKLKNMELNAKQLVEIVAGFNKIQQQIESFSSGFKQLKSIVNTNTVGFLSNEDMDKTKVAYDRLVEFTSKYKNINSEDPLSGVEAIKKEILQLIGLVTGDLKGGLYEYADYIHSQILSSVDHEVGQAVIAVGASMTGTKSNVQQQSSHAFTAKSDNVITVLALTTNEQNKQIQVRIDLGISDKSYRKGKASGKSIAEGVRWDSVMQQGGLFESAFEYYYANLMYFQDTRIFQSKSLINKFLAAKAAIFLIAGIADGSVPQAYFVRYADKIVYIPNIFQNFAKTKRGGFGIRPGNSITIQDFIQTPKDEVSDAFERTRNSVNKLRQNIKFNATR